MRRIDNLTGIRALAALWVVLEHLNLSEMPVAGTFGQIVRHGYFGVDLFFVLSGLVLSAVYAENLPPRFHWAWYRRFLGRRFAKIYPLHLLTLLAVIALFKGAARAHYHVGLSPNNDFRGAAYAALLIHSFGLKHGLAWNTQSWSVSAEWFAYSVLFAPMVFTLRRVRTANLVVPAAVLLVFMAQLSAWLGTPWTTFSRLGILRILPEFYCGFVLYRVIRHRRALHGDALSATGCLLLVLTCYLPHAELWLLLPAITVLLAGLYAGGPVSDRVFGNRLLVIFGDASYSIYLVQTIVGIACNQAFKHSGLSNTPLTRAGIDVVVPLATALTGLASFRFVEEPLRQAMLHFFEKRHGNPENLKAPAAPGLQQDTQVSATIG